MSLTEEFTSVQCEYCRLGNYESENSGEVTISAQGVSFHVLSAENKTLVLITIQWIEMKGALIYFGEADSMLFLYPQSSIVIEIEKKLGMTKAGFTYAYSGDEQSRWRLVILFKQTTAANEHFVRNLALSNSFIKEIDVGTAALLYHRAYTPLKNDLNSERKILDYGGIRITKADYGTLIEETYTNDVIINSYLLYHRNTILSTEDVERSILLDSFTFNKLTNPLKCDSKWNITQDNIFEKDYIIVPIHSNSHWFLAVICFPSLLHPVPFDKEEPVQEHNNAKTPKMEIDSDPFQNPGAKPSATFSKVPIKQTCILVFDSLKDQEYRPRNLAETLRRYLRTEYKKKFGIERDYNEVNCKESVVDVPQQQNSWDCGLYLLQYVESLFLAPINDFTLPITNLKEWFNQKLMRYKRCEVAKAIRKLIRDSGRNHRALNLPRIGPMDLLDEDDDYSDSSETSDESYEKDPGGVCDDTHNEKEGQGEVGDIDESLSGLDLRPS